MYVPELVLGTLMTGSNFDDSTARLTGGRHGFGAKLTNIFATRFIVETADTTARKLYRQEWTNNMMSRTDPVITDLPPGDADYTKVTVYPDMARASAMLCTCVCACGACTARTHTHTRARAVQASAACRASMLTRSGCSCGA